ncbi:MAG TPA: phytanoyl-CoA dioxygenase family protein [Thermoanaerobaculia bacterium]
MHTSSVTRDQQRSWRRDGFLLVRGALPPGQVAELLARIDDVVERYAGSEHGFRQSAAAYKVAEAITLTDCLDPLLDHERVFPLLLDLLGPYLQVLGTEIFVRPSTESQELLVAWHADGGPTLGRFLPRPGEPTLQLKTQFFLTDIPETDSGNFMFVPGSHRRLFPKEGLAATPPEAVQLTVRAGDALIFPWSLWHAVAPNHSGRARRSVTVRYGQLWSRPYDFERLPASVLARLTPRRRRLLGDLGDVHPSSYFYLDEEEQLRVMRG